MHERTRFPTNYAIAVLLLLAVHVAAARQATVPDKTKREPKLLGKSTGVPAYGILNIGNLTSWMRYDGINSSPSSDNVVYFPARKGNIIYKDALVWGGKAFLDAAHTIPAYHTVRVGGATYGTGTRSGYVTPRLLCAQEP